MVRLPRNGHGHGHGTGHPATRWAPVRLSGGVGGYAGHMPESTPDEAPATQEDPAVVGVPPETPDAVRPSATGLVTGPVDGETDVEVADVEGGGANDTESRYGTDESPA